MLLTYFASPASAYYFLKHVKFTVVLVEKGSLYGRVFSELTRSNRMQLDDE